MKTKAPRGTNSTGSGKRANSKSMPADSAEASTSDIPRSEGNGDNAAAFAAGTRVHVKGAGKHGLGTISSGPTVSGYVRYRCDFNMGEHIAKVENVTALKRRAA